MSEVERLLAQVKYLADQVRQLRGQRRIKSDPQQAAASAWHRAKHMSRVPAWADREKMRKFYEDCALINSRTGVRHHVDHIIPLAAETVSGLHCEDNLRVITARENQSRSARIRTTDAVLNPNSLVALN